MAVIRNLVVKIAADISSLSKGLQDAQKNTKGVGIVYKSRNEAHGKHNSSACGIRNGGS